MLISKSRRAVVPDRVVRGELRTETGGECFRQYLGVPARVSETTFEQTREVSAVRSAGVPPPSEKTFDDRPGGWRLSAHG